LTVANELADRRLALLPAPALTIPRPLHLLTNRHHTPQPATRAFLDLMHEQVNV
jgi:DNA-binding transcriptional LysR family regulator